MVRQRKKPRLPDNRGQKEPRRPSSDIVVPGAAGSNPLTERELAQFGRFLSTFLLDEELLEDFDEPELFDDEPRDDRVEPDDRLGLRLTEPVPDELELRGGRVEDEFEEPLPEELSLETVPLRLDDSLLDDELGLVTVLLDDELEDALESSRGTSFAPPMLSITRRGAGVLRQSRSDEDDSDRSADDSSGRLIVRVRVVVPSFEDEGLSCSPRLLTLPPRRQSSGVASREPDRSTRGLREDSGASVLSLSGDRPIAGDLEVRSESDPLLTTPGPVVAPPDSVRPVLDRLSSRSR